MYVPSLFAQTDQSKLIQLIHDHPLATLVTQSASGVAADHIPMRLVGDEARGYLLQGHIALANPLWQQPLQQQALAIFTGPAAYISPGYYPTKAEHGKVVPTWNYTVVHAAGLLSFIHDAEWKMTFLEQLTNQQERAQKKPWAVSDAPPDFTKKMLSAIVGFELQINELSGKWKVSQNQAEQNQQGVQQGLTADGHSQAAMLSGQTD